MADTLKLILDNPHRLSEKEQARRYRKIFRTLWTPTREVLDGKRDRSYFVREIATVLVDEILDPRIRNILDPELPWNADISRKGYTITIRPKSDRIVDLEWTD
jgi:hypothetical protein